jgi:hypothetical protein
MSSIQSISFEAIIKGRPASVRVTNDSLLYAVDVVMAVTGKNCNHSNECLRDLDVSLFDNENFVIRNKSRLLTFEHAIDLIMVLPGKIAKETRNQFAIIIRRYFEGDQSLHKEVNRNATSDAPIARLARASMRAEAAGGEEPVHDEQALSRKRRTEELEIQVLEVDLQAKKLANRSTEISHQSSERDHLVTLSNSYRDLCQDTVMDERARLMLKDCFLNAIMATQSGTQRLIHDAGGSEPPPNAPISLSSVATNLGLKIPDNDFISIGKELSKRYFIKHGKRPSKHDQMCKGKVLNVNSYFESDRPLVEEVLRWHDAGRV